MKFHIATASPSLLNCLITCGQNPEERITLEHKETTPFFALRRHLRALDNAQSLRNLGSLIKRHQLCLYAPEKVEDAWRVKVPARVRVMPQVGEAQFLSSGCAAIAMHPDLQMACAIAVAKSYFGDWVEIPDKGGKPVPCAVPSSSQIVSTSKENPHAT